MKIYLPGSRGTHRMFVQPGSKFPASHFMNAEGKPILFTVEFKNGEADVSRSLGRFMLDEKMAQRSPIILPESFNVLSAAI